MNQIALQSRYNVYFFVTVKLLRLTYLEIKSKKPTVRNYPSFKLSFKTNKGKYNFVTRRWSRDLLTPVVHNRSPPLIIKFITGDNTIIVPPS